MSLVKKTVTPKQLLAVQENGRKSRGPRTERGKNNSSRNSGKHLVLARVSPHSMKELGEDPEEFEKLRQSLRDALRPRDDFEEMLVEEMGVNRIRLARLHKAEAGILAVQRMEADDKKQMLALPQSQLSTDNLTIKPFGLAGVSESKAKYVQILELLLSVKAKVEKEGFSPQGFELLQTVYGDSSPGVTGSGLLSQYKAELDAQKPGADSRDDYEKGAARARFLEALGRDIRAFSSQLEAILLARTTPLPEPLLDSLLLLPQDELDKIMRYETHLERQFQGLLQRLMSWRKVYVDVPDAETWER
jgi:hypothetical protein